MVKLLTIYKLHLYSIKIPLNYKLKIWQKTFKIKDFRNIEHKKSLQLTNNQLLSNSNKRFIQLQ